MAINRIDKAVGGCEACGEKVARVVSGIGLCDVCRFDVEEQIPGFDEMIEAQIEAQMMEAGR